MMLTMTMPCAALSLATAAAMVYALRVVCCGFGNATAIYRPTAAAIAKTMVCAECVMMCAGWDMARAALAQVAAVGLFR